MRIILPIIVFFLSTQFVLSQSTASNTPPKEKIKKVQKQKRNRTKGPKQKDSFKVSGKKKKNKIGDGFTANSQTKDYGEKSKGKRTRVKRKEYTKSTSANDAFASGSQTKNYGSKARGKRSKSSR